MALSIMFYHLTIWLIMPLNSTSVLGRFGVYGVSIFFVLSGLSMAIVYNSYLISIKNSFYFYIRRIFRIWPLLWVVCILTIIPTIIKTGSFPYKSIILNFTTLFGFVKPTAYIATGSWSIGNEMVYYSLTPLIFFLYAKRKWAGNLFFYISLVIGLIFAFFILNPQQKLSDQWSNYVNPFNNLFLYIMGIFIYYNFKDVNIKPFINKFLLMIATLLFFFLPFKGDQISVLTGFGRLIYILLSFIIVLCFYKLNTNLPDFLTKILGAFGEATYGVYLIHPVIFTYVKYILGNAGLTNNIFLFFIVITLTILISIFSYKYFEVPLIKLGKRVTVK
jgi:exopolysaccharide production protein ExoZ